MYGGPLPRAHTSRIMPLVVTRTVLLLTLLSLQPALASAAPDEPRPRVEFPGAEPEEPAAGGGEEPEPSAGLRNLEEWLVLEEEQAPEPPLVRIEAGVLAFLETRTELTSFSGGVRGTELRNLEEEQGLDEDFVAPWIELTIGSKVRGGGDGFFFIRGGDRTVQQQPLVFDGQTIAAPGDSVRPRFSLLTLGTFVAWDALYGRTYRIGLMAGVRYFRLDARFEAYSGGGESTHRERGELVSPFFGGSFHLTPFPYFTVSTTVQFMNWAWGAVGLREARYFDFRLGAQLNVLPGRLSFALQYRFLVIQAAARDDGDSSGLEAAMQANGFAVAVVLAF